MRNSTRRIANRLILVSVLPVLSSFPIRNLPPPDARHRRHCNGVFYALVIHEESPPRLSDDKLGRKQKLHLFNIAHFPRADLGFQPKTSLAKPGCRAALRCDLDKVLAFRDRRFGNRFEVYELRSRVGPHPAQ